MSAKNTAKNNNKKSIISQCQVNNNTVKLLFTNKQLYEYFAIVSHVTIVLRYAVPKGKMSCEILSCTWWPHVLIKSCQNCALDTKIALKIKLKILVYIIYVYLNNA